MSRKQKIKELEKRIAELEMRIMGLEARTTQYRIPQYPNPWHPESPQKHHIDWWWWQPTDYSITAIND